MKANPRLAAMPILAIGLTGCFNRRAPAPPAPPMVMPRVKISAPKDPRIAPPPVLAEARWPVEELPPLPGTMRWPGPPRPQPKSVKKRPGVAQAVPEVGPQPADTPAALRLGEMLTVEQQGLLRDLYLNSSRRANRILTEVQGRMTPEQMESAERVSALLQQAVGALSRDLGTAAQLAQRADVLARDLRASVRP